jgi:hypothetical protein
MEFDKHKILTVATANQAKKGMKGWCADSMDYMMMKVIGYSPRELNGVGGLSETHPFYMGDFYWSLFYPVQEPAYPIFKVGDCVEITESFLVPAGTIGVVNYYEPDSTRMIVRALGFPWDVLKIKCKLITFRPFANAEEFKPYRNEWFRDKTFGGFEHFDYYNDEGAKNSIRIYLSYASLFKNFEMENGLPCGVKEESK